jgi:mono/diheme cytochrome c family protein
MTAVTDELAGVPEADVQAISTYIASMVPPGAPPEAPQGVPSARPPAALAADPATVALFTGACGGCHGADAPMTQAGAPPLSVSAALTAPTPQSAIRIVLQGIPWREGKAAPYMPAFADALTDPQVAHLVAYLRAHYSHLPPWSDIQAAVAKAREDSRS